MVVEQYPGEPLGPTRTVFVENYAGLSLLVDGTPIVVQAARSGRFQYSTVNGSQSTIEKYRCPDPPAPPSLREIEEERQAEERLAFRRAEYSRTNRLAMQARAVAYQHQQASNGLGSFQVELGRRYLRGEGVETNLTLAAHWLRSACTNGESQATNLLKSLPAAP